MKSDILEVKNQSVGVGIVNNSLNTHGMCRMIGGMGHKSMQIRPIVVCRTHSPKKMWVPPSAPAEPAVPGDAETSILRIVGLLLHIVAGVSSIDRH